MFGIALLRADQRSAVFCDAAGMVHAGKQLIRMSCQIKVL